MQYPDLVHFLMTSAFGFLIGLEVRAYRQAEEGFGGVATYTLTAVAGYLFYRIDPETLWPYTAVLAGLFGLYALYYRARLESGISLFLVLLCVYALGPLSVIAPVWLVSAVFVLLVFLLSSRRAIGRLMRLVNLYEFETLGKMVLLSAVILPLLPDHKLWAFLPLSPFKIWLAVVVISAISYGGYLAQKYLFPGKGYLVTGLIGGTYSSTATTVVLARKARQSASCEPEAGMVAATAVMYLRLMAVALLFNVGVGKSLALPFLSLSAVGFVVAFLLYRRGGDRREPMAFVDKNPLELGTALLFALLFVVMMGLTHYVIAHYGTAGLKTLSFLVGFTDIDPFVLSLLTGKYGVHTGEITGAVMISAGGNNLLKALYALWFGGVKETWRAALAIAVLGLATIVWAFMKFTT